MSSHPEVISVCDDIGIDSDLIETAKSECDGLDQHYGSIQDLPARREMLEHYRVCEATGACLCVPMMIGVAEAYALIAKGGSK